MRHPLPKLLDGDRPSALIAIALIAITKHESARDLARRCGPSLWPPGVVREVARCIIAGLPLPRTTDGTIGDARTLEALGAELSPHLTRDHHGGGRVLAVMDAEWAVSLVVLLAEVRNQPLLVDTFRWGAEAVLRGEPLRFIQRRMNAAVAIACGDAPLDPAETWDVGRQEVAA